MRKRLCGECGWNITGFIWLNPMIWSIHLKRAENPPVSGILLVRKKVWKFWLHYINLIVTGIYSLVHKSKCEFLVYITKDTRAYYHNATVIVVERFSERIWVYCKLLSNSLPYTVLLKDLQWAPLAEMASGKFVESSIASAKVQGQQCINSNKAFSH